MMGGRWRIVPERVLVQAELRPATKPLLECRYEEECGDRLHTGPAVVPRRIHERKVEAVLPPHVAGARWMQTRNHCLPTLGLRSGPQ